MQELPISDQLQHWLGSDGEKTLGSLIDVFQEKSFAILFVLLLGVSALLASWIPLQFSIVTVFLFAGPHNWFEARYVLGRLTRPASGIGNDLALGIMDGNGNSLRHDALGTVAEAEVHNGIEGKAAFGKVRMLGVEFVQAELERLVGATTLHGLGCLL
jgi:hypothetical protein